MYWNLLSLGFMKVNFFLWQRKWWVNRVIKLEKRWDILSLFLQAVFTYLVPVWPKANLRHVRTFKFCHNIKSACTTAVKQVSKHVHLLNSKCRISTISSKEIISSPWLIRSIRTDPNCPKNNYPCLWPNPAAWQYRRGRNLESWIVN